MKPIFIALLALCLCLSGCGEKETPNQNASLKAENEKLKADLENARLKAENEKLKSELGKAAGFIITSKPIGARVILGDGVPQLTPANFSGAPVGKHEIIISKRGFKKVRKVVQVENDKFFDLGEVLLERAFGSMELLTTPGGMDYELELLEKDSELRTLMAALSLKGKTPALLDKVPAGKYRVIFRREGWRDIVRELEVTDGSQPTAKGAFPEGTLKVESIPPGAKIEVGYRSAGTAPIAIPVLPGKYTVTASYKGMAPRELRATVEEGKESIVAFHHGTVRVIADPKDSRVTINGKDMGASPVEAMMPVGDISVSINYKDWPALESNRTLKAGTTDLVRIGYDYGTLQITSDPKGAFAYIDDKEIGKTPIKTFSLTGDYKVAVKHDISNSMEKTVRVNKEKSAEASFKDFLKPGTILWKFPSGGTVTSAPAIGRDGTIYFGEKTAGKLVLAAGTGKIYALNPDGTKKWEFKTDNEVTADPAIGADGTVYIGAGKFYALNGKTGEKKWEFKYKNSPNGFVNPINVSPAIGPKGTIFLGPQDGNIYALDGKTGANKWTHNTSDHRRFGYTPAPSIGSDGTLYIGSRNSRIRNNKNILEPEFEIFLALHGSTKEVEWETKLLMKDGLKRFSVHTSPAIGNDGTIYVGAHPDTVFAFDGKTGQLRWLFDTGGKPAKVRFTAPVIGADGTVYVGTDDNKVFALAGTTGKKIWVYSTQSSVHAPPVVGTDGVLYVITSGNNLKFINGKLIDPKSKIIALDGNTGAKKWDRELGDMTLASPTMGPDGTFYIGGSNQNRGWNVVYAIYTGSKGPARSAWPMRGQNAQHTGRVLEK